MGVFIVIPLEKILKWQISAIYLVLMAADLLHILYHVTLFIPTFNCY